MTLRVENLTVRYGGKPALEGLSFSLEAGQWLMVAGPNGAGKSTLLQALSQGTPYTGRILLNGQDLAAMKPRARAREMAVLAQRHMPYYGFTVGEVAAMGRYAYGRGPLSAPQGEDEGIVRYALAQTGMLPYAGRSILTLSGGERQRAFLAQAFAQTPRILLLDEPASHLDLPYQKQIFELLRAWLQTPGRAVVSVVHDLSLARAYGNRALLLRQGRVAALGAVEEALRPQNLEKVYAMNVHAWMRRMLSQWERDKM